MISFRSPLISSPTHLVPPGSSCFNNEQCSGGSNCILGMCICPLGYRIFNQQCISSRTGKSPYLFDSMVSTRFIYVSVPPGSPCTQGIDECSGGSSCIGAICTCPFGTQAVNQQCQRPPIGIIIRNCIPIQSVRSYNGTAIMRETNLNIKYSH